MKKYLNRYDRTIIEWELRRGTSLRQIAKQLGRAYSTITTEVRRHGGKNRYMASKAENDTKVALTKRGAQVQMAHHWDLLNYIEEHYDPKTNSLKLVLREWRKTHPEAPSLATLYNWVPRGLFGAMEGLLRPRERAMRELKQWKRMLGRPISLRESEQDMSAFGHWEGDFVVGGLTKAKGYVMTLVEKKSRFAITHKFDSTQPSVVLDEMRKLLTEFDVDVFKSITFDNGVEFTHLPQLEDEFATRIYFAFPYSAWQRGQNENWNGLLRRFFPKGTDFTKVSDKELAHVTNAFNKMPREILDFATPFDIFNRHVYPN